MNIPTGELRDFVVRDEDRPRTVLYPWDPGKIAMKVINHDGEGG